MIDRCARGFLRVSGCMIATALVLVYLGGCAAQPGGNGGNGGAGSDELQLSTGTLAIGEFLAIRHNSIQSGELRVVTLRQTDGMTQQHEVFAHQDGELALSAPPYFNPNGTALTGGSYLVSIEGVNDEQPVQVNDSAELPGVETGAVIELFIASALADIDSSLARLDSDVSGFDVAAEETTYRDALLKNRGYFEGLRAEWASSQTLTFPVSETENRVVEADEVREAERYLASMILGAHSELVRRGASPSSRIVGGNCINAGLEGDALVGCLQSCIDEVKATALRASQTAGVLSTAVGAGITIVGLYFTSQAVIVTGVVVTTAGVFHGFTTAYAADKNTDTFGQNDGEGFSAAREAVSQLIRYGANIVSAPASLLINAKDLASALESAKCEESNQEQRVIDNGSDQAFCQVVFDDFSPIVNTNITALGAGSASSQFSDQFPVAAALDGSSLTSWFSDGGNAADNSEAFTWQLIESGEVIISRVETDPEQFEGGGKFGFAAGTLRILDADGQVVFSQDYSFSGFRVVINQDIPMGTRGRTVQLIFAGHQDSECGGFAELRVFGRQI